MRQQSHPANHRLRRRRRILGAVPTVLASWAVLTGLPFSPTQTPAAGIMHSQVIDLTGPKAPTAAGARSRQAAPDAVGPGWSAVAEVDDGTQSVGLTWSGAAAGEVEVRGHAGTWGDWMHVHGDPSEGPDAANGVAGDLVWFGSEGVDKVEVRVEAGTLSNLQVRAMRYEQPESRGLGLQIATAGAADTRPSFQPRSAWTSKGWAYANSDCGNGPLTADGGVKYAVVHHTVNSNTYSRDDVPGMLASIYNFHTASTSSGGRGWCDIAYNFVIDRFGRTWEARSGGVENAIVGGHAAGYNTGSVGVSFLGQHQEGVSPAAVAPTADAVKAAGVVIGWKLGLTGFDPLSKVTTTTSGGKTVTIDRVVGHRNVGSTSCPGSLLYSQLSTIRDTAKVVQVQTTPSIPNTTTPGQGGKWGPFASPTSLVNQQYQDILGRPATSAEQSRWVGDLNAGVPPARFIASLASSREADSYSNAVIRLYKAYFLRNPDLGGYRFWRAKRASGDSLTSISQFFTVSSEFKNTYGSLSDGGFVDLVYQNVMGRRPDRGGRAFWVNKLSQRMPRGQMMASFSESPEYIRITLPAVQVVGMYESMIGRTIPDGTYEYLEPRLRTGITNVEGIAKYYFDKPEYRSRF